MKTEKNNQTSENEDERTDAIQAARD